MFHVFLPCCSPLPTAFLELRNGNGQVDAKQRRDARESFEGVWVVCDGFLGLKEYFLNALFSPLPLPLFLSVTPSSSSFFTPFFLSSLFLSFIVLAIVVSPPGQPKPIGYSAVL